MSNLKLIIYDGMSTLSLLAQHQKYFSNMILCARSDNILKIYQNKHDIPDITYKETIVIDEVKMYIYTQLTPGGEEITYTFFKPDVINKPVSDTEQTKTTKTTKTIIEITNNTDLDGETTSIGFL